MSTIVHLSICHNNSISFCHIILKLYYQMHKCFQLLGALDRSCFSLCRASLVSSHWDVLTSISAWQTSKCCSKQLEVATASLGRFTCYFLWVPAVSPVYLLKHIVKVCHHAGLSMTCLRRASSCRTNRRIIHPPDKMRVGNSGGYFWNKWEVCGSQGG